MTSYGREKESKLNDKVTQLKSEAKPTFKITGKQNIFVYIKVLELT